VKVVFIVPSHREENINYIHEVSTNCKSKEIGWAIGMNGPNLSSNYDFMWNNLVMEYKELTIHDPMISMAEARANADQTATTFFNPKYRILADHNFKYVRNWEEYILEAIDEMDKFTEITGRQCFMGMGGVLGSYGHGRKAFLGVQPIFSTSKGIIYSMANAYDKMLKLPSSLDEQYLCTILFMEGHVPLKKMMSPIIHTRIHDNEDIHNPEILANKFNTLVLREIWHDQNWVLQPKTTSKPPDLPDGRYYGHVPRTGLKAMAKLKTELSKIPGVYENFIKISYEKEAGKLTGKDLFS
jgi:hypothetical protein